MKLISFSKTEKFKEAIRFFPINELITSYNKKLQPAVEILLLNFLQSTPIVPLGKALMNKHTAYHALCILLLVTMLCFMKSMGQEKPTMNGTVKTMVNDAGNQPSPLTVTVLV